MRHPRKEGMARRVKIPPKVLAEMKERDDQRSARRKAALGAAIEAAKKDPAGMAPVGPAWRGVVVLGRLRKRR